MAFLPFLGVIWSLSVSFPARDNPNSETLTKRMVDLAVSKIVQKNLTGASGMCIYIYTRVYLYKYIKICAYICIYIQIGPTLIINHFSTHPSDATAIPMSFASTTWRKRAINRSKKAADCNSLGNGVDISWPWLDRWKPKIVAIRRIHMLTADLLKQIVCVPHIWHFIHHSPPSWVTCMVHQTYNFRWISYRNFILMQRPVTTRP